MNHVFCNSAARRGALATLFAGVALLLAAYPAFAQEATPEAPDVGGGIGGFGVWDWVNLGLRLGIVLLIIWAVVFGMRWYLRRSGGFAGSGPGRQLQILESRSLGPNRSIQLVRVGGRAVLIGVTQERVTRLIEIDDPDEVERLTELTGTQNDRATSLRSLVSGLNIAMDGVGAALRAPARARRQRAERGISPDATAFRGMRVADAQRALDGMSTLRARRREAGE